MKEASTALLKWFNNNFFKNKPDKCYLLISNNQNITVKIGKYEIENSECERLLRIKLDCKLNFDDHIFDVCKKARRKLNALIRIASFIGLSERRILMNAFFNSQFCDCPLIWMCCSRTNNRKINRLHERCSRFSELLEMNSSVFIHISNFQSLAIEMFCDS